MGDASCWYRDAVYYCLDVKTFKDTDGDGWGDFRGLTEQLDYLEWLGVDAVWLLPFYPSPNRDNGYDVSDHYGVNPRFGSPGEFVALMREAEARGMRIVADLVINHTSDEHPWFASARSGKRSPFFDFYIWSETPEREPPADIVFPGLVDSAWQYEPTAGAYYLHHFFEFQPDLNATHPAVKREIRNIIDYWLRLGISGFRLDAAPFLRNIHDPNEALFALLTDMRGWTQERSPHAVILAEADLPPEALSDYFGDGDRIQMLFNFVLNQALFLAFATEDATPITEAFADLPVPPAACHWLNFLRHHDELSLSRLNQRERAKIYAAFGPDPRMQIFGRGIRRRLASMLDGNRKRIELAFSLLFSLPGTPLINYGDEIGMGENLELPERSPFRTPMQWNGEGPHGGFSTAPLEDLVRPVIDGGPFSFRRINVAAQQHDPDSQLHWVRALVRARKACPEIARGEFTTLPTGSKAVFAHCCTDDHGTLVAVHNLAGESREVTLDVTIPGLEPLPGTERCEVSTGNSLNVRLQEYGHCWLRSRERKRQ